MDEKKYLEWKIKQDYNEIDHNFYKDFHYETKLDSSNRWRIYVSWNVKDKTIGDIIMPLDTYTEDRFDGSSMFGFDNFPLLLWDYGVYDGRHLIGLDQFPYSELTDEDSKSSLNKGLEKQVLSHEKINELAVQIIDCILEFQKESKKINDFNKKMYEIESQKQKIQEEFNAN